MNLRAARPRGIAKFKNFFRRKYAEIFRRIPNPAAKSGIILHFANISHVEYKPIHGFPPAAMREWQALFVFYSLNIIQ